MLVISSLIHSAWSACGLAGSNCLTCNGNNCESCPPGYGLRGTSTITCKPCGQNCVQCPVAGSNCTRCTSGYGPDFDSTNSSCTACSTSHCSFGMCYTYGSGTCDFCDDGYAPNQCGQCKACSPNCQDCSADGPGTCYTCKTGYIYVNSTKTCEVCPGVCVQCANSISSLT